MADKAESKAHAKFAAKMKEFEARLKAVEAKLKARRKKKSSA